MLDFTSAGWVAAGRGRGGRVAGAGCWGWAVNLAAPSGYYVSCGCRKFKRDDAHSLRRGVGHHPFSHARRPFASLGRFTLILYISKLLLFLLIRFAGGVWAGFVWVASLGCESPKSPSHQKYERPSLNLYEEPLLGYFYPFLGIKVQF